MTDIVQALRQGSLSKDDYRWEAADEIDRLRAALENIKDMTDYGTETATWRMTNAVHNANVIARTALEGKDD